jgi:3',5'-cyclic AMP phosphodiesterase CpdA
MVVVGLNSARSGSFARGRLNAGQVERAAARLQAATGPLVKIVVTHHPFELPPLHGDEHIIGRARMAMDLLARVGVDVFLAGHLHVSHVGQTAERYKIANHSALVVQAGTLSTRGRGEPNSFNVLRISHELITVERMAWQPAAAVFQPSWTGAFGRTAHGWVARPA